MKTTSVHAMVGLLMLGSASLSQGAQTTRASVDSGGGEAMGQSIDPSLSANGQVVTFHSSAFNLVPGDTNAVGDIFVRNLLTEQTTRVSVDSSGGEANAACITPALSGNGKVVAFASYADNLVTGDTNGAQDIFVRNLETGQTRRVSVRSNGMQANADSFNPVLSKNGQVVAFYSIATNLVPGDTNFAQDVFVHYLRTGKTKRVSVDSSGVQTPFGNGDSSNPSLSADGKIVAFESSATTLVPGDSNGVSCDVFVRNLQTGQTTLASIDSGGLQTIFSSYNATLSADGTVVAFTSVDLGEPVQDGGFAEIYVRNLQTGQTTLVSVASSGAREDADTYYSTLSGNGNIVAFESNATNLVPGDTNGNSDVFVRNLLTGKTKRVSVDSNGVQANGGGGLVPGVSLSNTGKVVAFQSFADNLVVNDMNAASDIFIRK